MNINPSYKAAHELKKLFPEKPENVTNSTYEVNCQLCGKLLMIEQVNVLGRDKNISINCSICHEPLRTANCFTLECRPFKRLWK